MHTTPMHNPTPTTAANVACPRSKPKIEHPDGNGNHDRRCEQANARIDARRQRRQRTCERDVTQRVGTEHLTAQHDEITDEPARGGDCRTGNERVPHERMREHIADPRRGTDHT